MNLFSEKKKRLIMGVIMIMSLIPVFVIGIYDHPSADDFGYSIKMHELLMSHHAGLIDVLKCAWDTSAHYMNTWQGLYSSAFLLSMQPAVFGEKYYVLTVFIIAASCFTGLLAITTAIKRYILHSDEKGAFFVSLLLLFYMIQGMPVPVEGLYWYNGAVNYLFFWGIMLFYIALLLRYRDSGKAYFSLLVAAVLGFLLSGGNHITAFLGILVSVILVIEAFVRKKGYLLIIPTVAGIAGFIFNVTSPGTAIRAAQDGTKSSVIKTVIRCGYEAAIANSKYMTFSLLLACFIGVPVMLKIVKKMESSDIFSIKNFLIICVFDYVIISAMYCVPYYAMGVFGEGRVEDTIYVTYSLLFFYTFMFAVGIFEKKVSVSERLKFLSEGIYKAVLPALMLSAVCYIAIAGNALKDYSTGVHALTEIADGSAKRYHEQNMDRLNKYNDPSEETIIVDNFTEKPILLYFRDMSTKAEEWPNTVMEKYFGKESISRKKSTVVDE